MRFNMMSSFVFDLPNKMKNLNNYYYFSLHTAWIELNVFSRATILFGPLQHFKVSIISSTQTSVFIPRITIVSGPLQYSKMFIQCSSFTHGIICIASSGMQLLDLLEITEILCKPLLPMVDSPFGEVVRAYALTGYGFLLYSRGTSRDFSPPTRVSPTWH